MVKIYDNKVGLLNVAGKNLDEALDYLKIMYGKVYSTLRGSSPSSFIDLSLGQLRSININFIGNVKYPGVHPVHPFSNVITGLIQAGGGVDTVGSLRKIKINRNNENFITVDLYDFFISGDNSESNIQLRDGDIVIVPDRQSFVYVDSAVLKPGVFETVGTESIYDVISFAGGRKYNGSNKIGISRQPSFTSDSAEKIMYLFMLTTNDSKSIIAKSGDLITVLPNLINNNYVQIIGQVKRPGIYYFNEGMTLNNLFDLSSGFNDKSFLKSVNLTRGKIIRMSSEKEYEDIINFNIDEVFFDKKRYIT